MYARSLNANRKNRYTPPPGYTGGAFGAREPEDGLIGKVHPAGENAFPEASARGFRPEIGTEAREPDASRDFLRGSPRETTPPDGEERAAKPALPAALTGLLGELRESVGAEEIILLLVMLLCASEGAGVEALLLALLLVAGKEPRGSE